MTPPRRIYLDHAATSWPKSESVIDAMARFQRDCGAAAGRGGYRSAGEADNVVSLTRRSIASLIGASNPQCISLHSNGTAALNAAIHGVLRPGDHVVTSAAEHNSVLRPLRYWEMKQGIRLTVVPTNTSGWVDTEQLIDAVTEQTRMVTLTHASNVTGAVQNVAEVGKALKDHPAIFLCDAAQTFGTLAIDVADWSVDMLAAPGHKASGGPLGTGFLYTAPAIHDQIVPSIQGGTGSQSESVEMPTSMPSKLEPGNLNVPALAGWSAALDELAAADAEERLQASRRLSQELHEGLRSVPHVRIFGHAGDLPIASVSIEGLSPTDAAVVLDVEYGIETRAGMHCAALIHQHLGSAQEGTLRLSGGHNTTVAEVKAAVEAVRSIATALHLPMP